LSSRKVPDTKKSLPSADAPSEKVFPVVPTLVVLWSHDQRAMAGLREGVQRRLAPLAEAGALEWIGPFSSEDEITPEGLARACETLLSLDLWRRLVERGYQPDLPRTGSPVSLQVVFLVDRMGAESEGPPLKVIQEAQKLLARRARLAPILVWLGSQPEPAPQNLNAYWPRIRMEPVAAGGFAVNPLQVLAAAEHLLVALMGSDFVRILGSIVKESSTEWIVLGASALMLHPHIEGWLREAVLGEILAPLVAPLAETEIDRIEKAIGERARQVRESLLEEASAALKESGWGVEIEHLGIRKCILQKAALLEALFGAYRGGITAEPLSRRDGKNWPRQLLSLISALAEPFFPGQTIGETLYHNYRELSERLEQWLGEKWRGLAPRAREEYQDIAVLLGSFLDRGLVAQISPEKRPSWWFTERPLPAGIPAAITALLALQKHLCEGNDLEDARGPVREPVRPAPLNDDAYLRVAGDTDAQIVRENLLRYAHFARTLASPWGVLLYLIPAWPLGTFLIQILVHWEPAPAFLVTGLALLLIGIAELAYWWLWKARSLLKTVQRNAHRALASRVMTLTARAIQDYRYWMLSRLREAECVLVDLYAAFLQRYAATKEPSRSLREVRSQEVNGCTYLMVHKGEIQRWKREAVKALQQYPDWKGESGPFESAITARIVARVWPLPEQPLPSQAMLEELESASARVVRECAPHPHQYKAGVVAEMEVDPLKGGKRWNWLWQRAYPLGIVESPGAEFTIVMAPEEALSGPTGRESPYWQPDWRTALTLQGQEEMCIRGIVERKRGE
jgi:hypothetical protein